MAVVGFGARGAEGRMSGGHRAALVAVSLLVASPVAVLRTPASAVAQVAEQPAGEPRDEDRAATRRLIEENCLICHSDEMIVRQRLTPAQWGAEVDKMIGWGAPLPAEHKEGVVAFLAGSYGTGLPLPPPARVGYEEALSGIAPGPSAVASLPHDAGRGALLYRRQCANCHGREGAGGDLGPNLLAMPVLLRPVDYDAVVLDGRRKMPGFRRAITAEESAEILAWLRSRP